MFFYSFWDKKQHGDLTEASFRATALANEYSLCSMEIPGILTWLEQCIESGIITEKDTGLPMREPGSAAFIEALVNKISYREGFGNILAEGVMRAADALGLAQKSWPLIILPKPAGVSRTGENILTLRPHFCNRAATVCN